MTVADEIRDLNDQFEKALAAGDAPAIARLYAVDATVVPPGAEPQTGRDAIQAFWQATIDQGVGSGRLETVAIDESGDLAVERGRYTLDVAGQRASGNYVVVHQRQPDGELRLLRDIWN